MTTIAIILLCLHIAAFIVPLLLMYFWRNIEEGIAVACVILIISNFISGSAYLCNSSDFNSYLQELKTINNKIAIMEDVLNQNFNQVQENVVNINSTNTLLVKADHDTPVKTTTEVIAEHNQKLINYRMKQIELVDELNKFRYGCMQYVTWGSDFSLLEKVEAQMFSGK